MSEPAAGTEVSLERLVHDLCQPLTTLQCLLELGKMVDDEPALREAVEGALAECGRMFVSITAMRAQLVESKKRLEN